MQSQRRFVTWLATFGLSAAFALVAIAGCTASTEPPSRGSTGGSTSTTNGTGGGISSGGSTSTTNGTGGTSVNVGLGGGTGTTDPGKCEVNCNPLGGQYCG